MPTRKDLHDRTRAEQRQQLQAIKADNPKSAIVSLGARHDDTGLFDVILADGSVEIGEKTFNSSLPEGSQVLGIPKTEGGWLLDERDAVVSPIAPVVEAPTGKIKYLYSVLNADGSRDLWLGGWQPKPVKIKAINPGDQQFTLKNPGGNRFWLDYIRDVAVADGYYYTLTEAGLLYEHRSTDAPNTGFDVLGLNPYGYSFWSRGAYGSSGGGTGSFWGRLFQNDFIGGINVGIAFKRYLTPTLVSPETFISDNPVYLPYAITADGSKGVGVKITFVGSSSTTKLITYDAAIFDTGVDESSIPNGYFDCFHNGFTIIDSATIAANALTQPTFTAQIYTYDYAGLQQRVSKEKVYGIPTAQRNSATLIGQPSYHLRTAALKP